MLPFVYLSILVPWPGSFSILKFRLYTINVYMKQNEYIVEYIENVFTFNWGEILHETRQWNFHAPELFR